jgi:hypothetical protein
MNFWESTEAERKLVLEVPIGKLTAYQITEVLYHFLGFNKEMLNFVADQVKEAQEESLRRADAGD